MQMNLEVSKCCLCMEGDMRKRKDRSNLDEGLLYFVDKRFIEMIMRYWWNWRNRQMLLLRLFDQEGSSNNEPVDQNLDVMWLGNTSAFCRGETNIPINSFTWIQSENGRLLIMCWIFNRQGHAKRSRN